MDKEADIPVKTESDSTSTRFNQPWFEQKHRRLVKKKQRLYNKAKSSGQKNHWDDYYEYRKTVQRELRRAKREFYQEEENLGVGKETGVTGDNKIIAENKENTVDVVETHKKEILNTEIEVDKKIITEDKDTTNLPVNQQQSQSNLTKFTQVWHSFH